MSSVEPTVPHLDLHDAEYLRGAEKDNQECTGLFKEYQKCLGVSVVCLAVGLF